MVQERARSSTRSPLCLVSQCHSTTESQPDSSCPPAIGVLTRHMIPVASGHPRPECTQRTEGHAARPRVRRPALRSGAGRPRDRQRRDALRKRRADWTQHRAACPPPPPPAQNRAFHRRTGTVLHIYPRSRESTHGCRLSTRRLSWAPKVRPPAALTAATVSSARARTSSSGSWNAASTCGRCRASFCSNRKHCHSSGRGTSLANSRLARRSSHITTLCIAKTLAADLSDQSGAA